MEAASLTAAVPRFHRWNVVSHLVRRVRVHTRARRITALPVAIRVASNQRVATNMIDAAAWLEWGRQNLTEAEYERRCRAVEADRTGQREAVC